jgi:hypothetical protein
MNYEFSIFLSQYQIKILLGVLRSHYFLKNIFYYMIDFEFIIKFFIF